jgi:DNA-binding NarL/FixJ family response regulator
MTRDRNAPTVVLVDDDEENSTLLAAALADEVTVVGQFGTAADAVAWVVELRPDVVLMDLRLPDMSGIEATRRIVDQAWPTQVIVLTAYDGTLPTRSAQAVGAFTYLVKGSQLSVIRGAIFRAWAFGRALDRRTGRAGDRLNRV